MSAVEKIIDLRKDACWSNGTVFARQMWVFNIDNSGRNENGLITNDEQ